MIKRIKSLIAHSWIHIIASWATIIMGSFYMFKNFDPYIILLIVLCCLAAGAFIFSMHVYYRKEKRIIGRFLKRQNSIEITRNELQKNFFGSEDIARVCTRCNDGKCAVIGISKIENHLTESDNMVIPILINGCLSCGHISLYNLSHYYKFGEDKKSKR